MIFHLLVILMIDPLTLLYSLNLRGRSPKSRQLLQTTELFPREFVCFRRHSPLDDSDIAY